MPDDALDKAAEAVRNWIDAYVCSFCERPWRCKVCRTGKTMNKAEDIARAVLEAAAEKADHTCATCNWWQRDVREHDPRTGLNRWWGSCHASCERMEAEGEVDSWAELRTREDFGCVCWTALQRAGKEA